MVKLPAHNFDPEVFMCRRCGASALSRDDRKQQCHHPRANVTSLDWWRQHISHKKLRRQLEASVAMELGV